MDQVKARSTKMICALLHIYIYANILSKTIEGYGFYFNFIAKGIIFSTQIINRLQNHHCANISDGNRLDFHNIDHRFKASD